MLKKKFHSNQEANGSHVFLEYPTIIQDDTLGGGRKPFICQTLTEYQMGARHWEQPFLSCLETAWGGRHTPPPSDWILLGASLSYENNARRGVNCPTTLMITTFKIKIVLWEVSFSTQDVGNSSYNLLYSTFLHLLLRSHVITLFCVSHEDRNVLWGR